MAEKPEAADYELVGVVGLSAYDEWKSGYVGGEIFPWTKLPDARTEPFFFKKLPVGTQLFALNSPPPAASGSSSQALDSDEQEKS